MQGEPHDCSEAAAAAGHPVVRKELRSYIHDDMGSGDASTLMSLRDPSMRVSGTMVAHSGCVAAGLEFMPVLMEEVDAMVLTSRAPPSICRRLAGDGGRVGAGTELLHVEGSATAVLLFERTALNMVSRMSAIATLTSELMNINPSPIALITA